MQQFLRTIRYIGTNHTEAIAAAAHYLFEIGPRTLSFEFVVHGVLWLVFDTGEYSYHQSQGYQERFRRYPYPRNAVVDTRQLEQTCWDQ